MQSAQTTASPWPPRLLALGLAMLTGCASHCAQVDQALMANHAAPAHTQDVAEHYKVGCPDVLEIVVAGHPELAPAQKRIQADGTVDLGSFGRIRVEGYGSGEIADQVARVAGLPRAAVQVHVAEYNSEQIYVFGEIKGQQRVVPYRGPETVSDLLQRLGGITPGAEPKDVYVVRANVAEGRRPEVHPIDLRAIVLRHDQRTNLKLEPCDQVFIGETSQSSYKKCIPPCLLPLYEALCGLNHTPSSPSPPSPGLLGVIARGVP
jgi:protein involved in polysaccharide export with SLBB domain